MYVAEEQMANIVVTGQYLANMVTVSPKSETVDTILTDVKRRVVHEQINRLTSGRLEGLTQPFTALLAIRPPSLSLLDSIEQQKTPGAGLKCRLHETIGIDGDIGKHRQRLLPPIMIADHEMHRQLQSGQAVAQIAIGLGLTGLREVAGDYTQLGIAVIAIDIINARFEALVRIEAVQDLPAWHEVQVGELDEFHWGRKMIELMASRKNVPEIRIGLHPK